jgi:adenylate cyclase
LVACLRIHYCIYSFLHKIPRTIQTKTADKKQFEHYLDPRQVKQLQKDPGLLKLGGEKKTCTFIFTDLRGFTALSESVEPEQVTYIMNKVLSAQVKAVQKHGGMVDKFIGDAGMYIFNAPLDMLHHPKIAVECAIDIIKNVGEVNLELVAEGCRL